MKCGLTILCLLCLTTTLFSQQVLEERGSHFRDHNEVMDELIQERIVFVAEQSNNEIDINALTELYWQFLQQPILLELSNMNQVVSLQLLNTQQIIALKAHLLKYESLLSIYELQTISFFDLNTLKMIAPFVRASYGKNQLADEGKHDLMWRSSFTNSSTVFPKKNPEHLGSPIKHYLRYRYTSSNLLVGLSAENDSGEAFFTKNNSAGFDFYGGFVGLKKLGRINNLIIGDYQASFGQGLNVWTGFGFGKTSNSQLVAKNGSGIRAYSSAQEYDFLRGITASLSIKNFTVSPFLLLRKTEGNITDTINDNFIFSSVESSGLHRTDKELKKKNATSTKGFGTNVNYQLKNGQIGVTYFGYSYNANIPNNGSLYESVLPENQNKLQRLSIDALLTIKNGIWFFEAARDNNNKKGIILGTTQALGKKVNTTILFRHLDAGYQNKYNLPFSDGSGTNESGFYAGTILQLSSRQSIEAYADFYKMPWVNRYSYALGNGKDFLLKWKYERRRNWLCYAMYRYRIESDTWSNNDANIINPLVDENVSNLRFHLTKQINKQLSWQSRLATSFYNKFTLNETGWLTYQELSYKKKALTVAGRYTIFNTNSYNTRIYAYEKDVLYAFKTPAYYGVGQSFYLLAKCKLNRQISCWVRFGRTTTNSFINLDEDLALVNKKFNGTAQIRITF